jgi:hypothetical protein
MDFLVDESAQDGADGTTAAFGCERIATRILRASCAFVQRSDIGSPVTSGLPTRGSPLHGRHGAQLFLNAS